MTRWLTLVLAALLGVFASILATDAAHARGNVDRFTFEVEVPEAARFDPAAAERAYDEIRSAALRACRWSPGRNSLQERRFQRACAADLVEKVVVASGNSLLLAAYNDESPSFRVADRQYRRIVALADAHGEDDARQRPTTRRASADRTVRSSWYG